MKIPFQLSNEAEHIIDVDTITAIRKPKSVGKAAKWQIKIFFVWRDDSLIFEYEDEEVAVDDYNKIVDIIFKGEK